MRDSLIKTYHVALWTYANWLNADYRRPPKRATRAPGAKHVTIRTAPHDGWGREVLIQNGQLWLTSSAWEVEEFHPECYKGLSDLEILTSLIAVAAVMRPSQFDIWVGVDPADLETVRAILTMERLA